MRSAQKTRSPALKNRPEMKGVCLKTGTTKPKKPNSGARKIAKIKLSSGRIVTAYIPGEGEYHFDMIWLYVSIGVTSTFSTASLNPANPMVKRIGRLRGR